MIPDKKPEMQETQNAESQDEGQGQDGLRPEWLPENYWNPETGEAEIKKLVGALSDTQTALRNKKEELREEIKAELKKDLPTDPADYIVDPNDLSLPENSTFTIPDDDPLMPRVRKWAHEAGISQEQFKGLVNEYANAVVEMTPNAAKEKEALGENADTRLQRVAALAGKALSDEEWPVFQVMTQTARGVEIIEKLLDSSKGSSPQSFDSGSDSIATVEEEINEIMATDGYWRRDPATIARFERLQKRLSSRGGRV